MEYSQASLDPISYRGGGADLFVLHPHLANPINITFQFNIHFLIFLSTADLCLQFYFILCKYILFLILKIWPNKPVLNKVYASSISEISIAVLKLFVTSSQLV